MRRRQFTAALLAGAFVLPGCVSRPGGPDNSAGPGADPSDSDSPEETDPPFETTDAPTQTTARPTHKDTRTAAQGAFEGGDVRFRVVDEYGGRNMATEDTASVTFDAGEARATVDGKVHVDGCYRAALGAVEYDTDAKRLTVVVVRESEEFAASEVHCEHYTATYRVVVEAESDVPDEIRVVHRGPEGGTTREKTAHEPE